LETTKLTAQSVDVCTLLKDVVLVDVVFLLEYLQNLNSDLIIWHNFFKDIIFGFGFAG